MKKISPDLTPHIELEEELVYTSGSVIPKSPFDDLIQLFPELETIAATAEDIKDRMREQDERYMVKVTSNERMTREWTKYGKKHSERISQTFYPGNRRGKEK